MTQEKPPQKAEFYRSSVAVPMRQKAELERRLTAAGLATVGELVKVFLNAPTAVEALISLKGEMEATATPSKKETLKQLQELSAEELARALELVRERGQA